MKHTKRKALKKKQMNSLETIMMLMDKITNDIQFIIRTMNQGC